MKKSICSVVVAVFLFGLVPYFAYGYTVPSGFSKIQSATGVELYKKTYSGGQPDYVQVINLSKGASIKLLHGSVVNTGDKGPYCGNVPTFKRQSLKDAWSGLTASYSNAFSITNGQFFATNDNPTKLAFPLKKDSVVVNDGYGKNEFPNEKLALRIWSSYADIVSFDNTYGNILCSSSAPNIIVGLTETANKGPTNYVGRTFLGVLDDNADGKSECVLIFNSSYTRQADAAKVLTSFGARKVMMLDGGDSTQMNCKGTSYISSSRSIPQTIAVLSSNDSGFVNYSGYLGSKQSAYQPNGTYYYSSKSGIHSGRLDGPSNADFDLYLYKWNGSSWQSVKSSTSYLPKESIDYTGSSGYYTWRIYSYSGSGNYTLSIKKP